MRKRVLGIFSALILVVLLYFVLKNIMFSDEANFFIRQTKLIIFAIGCAWIILVPIYVIRKYAILKPYFAKFYTFRSLLYQLVKRDFKAKYKRSVLGIVWTVLNPLLTMLVLTIVFSNLFRFNIENYPVYLLSGQVIFAFFSESTSLAMESVIASAGLIKKVSMPKYIFPVSKVLSSLVNFFLSLIALLLVMIITGTHFSPTMFLMVIPIIYIFLFSTGVGLFLSAINVFFRDITYLYGILLTILTYFTPIFYPIEIIPANFRIFISLNPMYHFVEYFRTVAIYGGLPSLWQNVVGLSLGILTLSIGLFVFYKAQDKLVLYI